MKSLLLSSSAAIALLTAVPASAGAHGPEIKYVPKSLVESVINRGPWALHQAGDDFAHDASGIVPGASNKNPKPPPLYIGSGTPYADYCTQSGKFVKNHGLSLMQPYYFPFVRGREGGILEGYFDYRPRNEQEAVVAAISSDWGASWHFQGEALALNPYCPFDATDPDDLYVTVNGVKTEYGNNADNAADNGLGHPVVLTVNGVQRIYQLNRANNHIDSDQLVVHSLNPWALGSLAGLPDRGFVSPFAPPPGTPPDQLGKFYPTLDSTATSTSGLINPDALIGAVNLGRVTAVIYVSKTLNGDIHYPSNEICPSTPSFALTNLVNKKVRKPNDDVTLVRVATTTDGVTFTDIGTAPSLNDPTAVALDATRYLGSGSIIRLTDGRYGMFFGAGNCLDNDSDGFHYIGYAETVKKVRDPDDLKDWKVIYDLDHPILSTDTVTDVTDPKHPRPYPLRRPVVDVSGADALTASQVFPFVPPKPSSPLVIPPGGYNSNFFSGRVYDPQAIYTDEKTVTIVFAGYNTPQPSNNLGDYRTIGRFQLHFPAGYVARPH
jgi:hypothetical protein